ncbi:MULTISPECIES: YacL family protein [Pasteurellaceae]|uniref:UPF0231 protein HMPREF1052_1801 n=1 Tax=Pasteurella bettyae CCUG 2042 TaxID=1095749 RepID=I3D9H4_9PAST|nr:MULTISPECIES: YacL family protein [Pasteurellaceae]EIJ68367.1 hypothetical protein HMPREF1052_1801 [Pasteurella bettyae CCUG 2042]SUB21518.1 Uncharacterised protein family (UPF0231) [Pasteurella bettyae]
MDFRFTYDLGSVIAKCSMGHEAVANWFNTEVRCDFQKIHTALIALKQAKIGLPQHQEIRLIGAEYSVFIHSDEVLIKANNLDIADSNEQEMEQDFNYYNEESIAFCGLEDFERFLLSYLEFMDMPSST